MAAIEGVYEPGIFLFSDLNMPINAHHHHHYLAAPRGSGKDAS